MSLIAPEGGSCRLIVNVTQCSESEGGTLQRGQAARQDGMLQFLIFTGTVHELLQSS